MAVFAKTPLRSTEVTCHQGAVTSGVLFSALNGMKMCRSEDSCPCKEKGCARVRDWSLVLISVFASLATWTSLDVERHYVHRINEIPKENKKIHSSFWVWFSVMLRTCWTIQQHNGSKNANIPILVSFYWQSGKEETFYVCMTSFVIITVRTWAGIFTLKAKLWIILLKYALSPIMYYLSRAQNC